MRYALSQGRLLSISRYADLANPPQDLTCPGQDTHGRPCRAPVGARALTSKHVRPHFWSRKHIAGCDEGDAAESAVKGHRDGSITTRTRHEGPTLFLVTTGPGTSAGTATPTSRTQAAGRPMATAQPGPDSRRNAPTQSTTTLASLLTYAMDGRLDPQALIALPGQRPGPVNQLVRPANTLTPAHKGLRACFYGKVTNYAENAPTKSIFLHLVHQPGTRPRDTAAIMIRNDQALSIQDNLDASIGDLAGHHVIVIGTLRVSQKTGSLYIAIADTSHIAYQP
jgi:hypothetical protein